MAVVLHMVPLINPKKNQFIKMRGVSLFLKIHMLIVMILLSITTSMSQKTVGIGTSTPDTNAALHIHSNNKGVLFPRMTTYERDQIVLLPQGLHIYNTDDQCLNYADYNIYGGSVWNCYCPSCRKHLGLLVWIEDSPNNGNTPADLNIYKKYAMMSEDDGYQHRIFYNESYDNWVQQAYIYAPYLSSVNAISEEFACYSEPTYNSLKGRVHILKRNGVTWEPFQIISATDQTNSNRFGMDLSISGNYLLVGSLGERVYVFKFENNTWTQQAEILAPVFSESFGTDLAIDGTTFIVGANTADVNGHDAAGAAYVFVLNGGSWVQQVKLTASDASAGDRLGWSVDITGNYAIVGASRKTVGNQGQQGKAYIFFRNGTAWTQQAGLVSSDGNELDHFGECVRIQGDQAFIVAGNFTQGVIQGKGYLFQRNNSTWNEIETFVHSNDIPRFNHFADIYQNYIIMGGFQNPLLPPFTNYHTVIIQRP